MALVLKRVDVTARGQKPNYLAIVIAFFARRVGGWAVNNRLHRKSALQALQMATAKRANPSHGRAMEANNAPLTVRSC